MPPPTQPQYLITIYWAREMTFILFHKMCGQLKEFFFKAMETLLGNLYFIDESILESAHWNNKKGKPDIYVLKSETRDKAIVCII